MAKRKCKYGRRRDGKCRRKPKASGLGAANRPRGQSVAVRVKIDCDAYDTCCARRPGARGREESICGVEYKFPFDTFNVTATDRRRIDAGRTVTKLVGRFTWYDALDAWGDGLF